MAYEAKFAEQSRLFALDARRRAGLIRFTVAFRILFAMQLVFGLGVVAYGVCNWVGAL